MTLPRNIGATCTADSSEQALGAPAYAQDYARRFMVVAGVNKYSGGDLLPSLATPVADACRLFRILRDQYGFEGRLLAEREAVQAFEGQGVQGASLEPHIEGNGTAGDIQQALWAIAREARPEDLFLFYYGGHGITENELGFLLPFGASWKQYDTYLMYPTLFGAFEAIPSLHKMLFFDCCFSGVVTRDISSVCEPKKGEEAAQRNCDTSRILLKPAMAAFASTDAFNLAPDAFHEWSDPAGRKSAHSPFADSLAELLDKADGDEGLFPAKIQTALHDGVRERVRMVPAKDGRALPLRPVARLTGTATILLRKAGIRIDCPGTATVQSGETKSLPLRISGKARNEVSLKLVDAPAGVELRGDRLVLDGAALPSGASSATLEVSRHTGGCCRKTVEVYRTEHVAEPLVLQTLDLPPCYVEDDYRAVLEIAGGIPPLSIEAEGLPRGLDMSRSGEIYGRVPAETATGGGCLVEVVVTVTDQGGNRLHERLALPVIDPNVYVEVPAGDVRFGYHATATRTKTLTALQESNKALQKRADEHPGGQAPIPGFFIRRRPVSNRDWAEFIAATGHAGLPKRWDTEDGETFWSREGDMPTTGLSGKDIEAFCNWRHTKLPNRFQWERAARGEDGRLFPWGDSFAPHRCNCPEQHSSIYGAEMVAKHPELFLTHVDQFPHAESPFGVADLVGNCWELTRHIVLDRAGHPRLARKGGSIAAGGINLVAAFGCRRDNSVAGELDLSGLCVRPSDGEMPPLTGFRDVIELSRAPFYRQGWVRLEAGSLRLPWALSVCLPCDVYLARYQVSNSEYRRFVLDTGHRIPAHWSKENEWLFPFPWRFLPVVNVSREDAEVFCRWKSEQLGQRCLPLTPAVWRMAVHRGRTENEMRRYPWGEEYAPAHCNHPQAGYGGLVGVDDLAAGRAACGASNLVGNAAEWVSDTSVAGGSWLHGVNAPEQFIAQRTEAGPDTGFRYFTYDPPPIREETESSVSHSEAKPPAW